MKKYCLGILSLLLLNLYCFGQNSIYSDAYKLRSKYDADLGKIKLDDNDKKLLSNYYPTFLKTGIVKEKLDSNTFFKEMFDVERGNGLGNSPYKNDLLGSIGGLNVATVADGLAQFIVNRTKQELSASFFIKFKEEISSEKFKDLQSIFPQTHHALLAIGEDIYNYTAYLQILRSCFEKDLATLPDNLPSILVNHEAFFNSNMELKAILISSFYVSEQLRDAQHPGVIIENYPDSIWKKCDARFYNSIRLLKLISSSFRDSIPTKNYWISTKKFNDFYSDTMVVKLYMGLLSQKAILNKIEFNDVNFGLLLQKDKIFTFDFYSFSHGFFKKAHELDAKIELLNKSTNDSLQIERYYGFAMSTLDLMKYSTKMYKFLYTVEGKNVIPSSEFNLRIDKYFNAATSSANLLIDVNRKNYSSALVDAHYLLSIVFPKNVDLPYGDSGNLNNIIKVESDVLLNRLMKYGNFIATVSQANSSKEVSQAIEAISLPAGSSRVKRNTPFNISLNAYAGLFTGYEYIKGVDNGSVKLNSYGLTAPVGIAISRGHSLFFIGTGKNGWKKNKYGWSSSFFVSAIDIGALAAFRFTNDSTEKVPDIQLKDIISPGAFISIGIPKTPISVNFGYQVGPLLRKVTQSNNTYDNSYSRLSIGLCVDIPIFNFYSKAIK